MLFITKEYYQGHKKPQEQRLKEKVEIQLPNKVKTRLCDSKTITHKLKTITQDV
jgi:hypothetical protein